MWKLDISRNPSGSDRPEIPFSEGRDEDSGKSEGVDLR